MDKETLSNYGWIVICVLVLAVMLALATPFGTFIADGFKATYTGLFQTGDNAMDTALGAVGIDTSTSPVIKIDQELSRSSNNPTIVDSNTYALSGKIEDNNGIKTLLINGSGVAVNSDGTWASNINLTQNELLELTITATNTKDKSTTEKYYIGYLIIYDVTISTYFDFSEIGYEKGVTTYLDMPGIYQTKNGLWKRIVGLGTQNFMYSKLKTLIIPDTVTSVGSNAFGYGYDLETVVLGDGMTYVGVGMFGACEKLNNITFGKNITSIEQAAFSGCKGLTTINIPEGITKIGNSSFSGCTGLTSIVLPVSLETVEREAFRDCKNITDVYYRGTQEQWEAIAFDNTYNYHYQILTNATIHYNYTGE